MATKKQKHAEALARREEFLAKERAIGQKAIEVEARKREARTREMWEKGHKKHYKFVDECPHCISIKEEQARKRAVAEIERVAAAAKFMLEGQTPKGRKVLDIPQDGLLENDQGEAIDLSRVEKVS